MYRYEHPDQLSFKDFFLLLVSQLSDDYRRINLFGLIQLVELEADCATKFGKGFGLSAKLLRMALRFDHRGPSRHHGCKTGRTD